MKRMMLLAAACIALTACSKNEKPFTAGQEVTLSVNSGQGIQAKLTSSLNGSTQAVDFLWETGDKIKVTVGGASSVFTLSSGAGTSTAEFTGVMPASGTVFDVQFPATDPDLTTQTYIAGALPKNMMKATATGCTTGSAFSLTPVNAALRLNLYGSGITVSKIVVTNTSAGDPKPSYTLDCGVGVALGSSSSAAVPFFLVVPNGSYKFKARIFDSSSVPVCSFEPSAAQSLAATSVLNMPSKDVSRPHYIENGTDYGTGIVMDLGSSLGHVVWAPVNCGIGSSHSIPCGLLYQWGRIYGQSYDSGKLTAVSLTKASGQTSANKDNFGSYNATTRNWFSGTVDDTLWNGEGKGSYDPCPAGWRVPTGDELSGLASVSGGSSWVTGKDVTGLGSGTLNGRLFGSAPEQLFLPAAGLRSYSSGSASSKGDKGYYWSSTGQSTAAKYLIFYDTDVNMTASYRAYGFSVRCVLQ